MKIFDMAAEDALGMSQTIGLPRYDMQSKNTFINFEEHSSDGASAGAVSAPELPSSCFMHIEATEKVGIHTMHSAAEVPHQSAQSTMSN